FGQHRGIRQWDCRRPGERLDRPQQRGTLRVRGGNQCRAAPGRRPDHQRRAAQHLHQCPTDAPPGTAQLPGHPGAAIRGRHARGRTRRRGFQRIHRRCPGFRRRRRAQPEWAAVSVSQEGFRAGLGRQLAGGAGGTGTDYVNLSANNFHAQKGEGIAGTPQHVFDSRTGGTVNNLVDGYPNGSTARGAPATAGGGGTDPHPSANDQNTGGGGGANGGAGGMGGNSWNTSLAMGGFGGTAFPATAARVTAGAGGGAGTRNNAGPANASSGGNGGAIVMIRTGSVTGTGSITTDGGTGVVPLNDGGGGGGAGGTVVVVAQTGSLAGLTVNARGGAGANAWLTDAGGAPAYHGPGGGGGGGAVLSTSALGTVNVSGGVNGTTTTSQNAFGATPGALGSQATITASQIPGASSGAECTPDLALAKSHADPYVRGSSGTYTLTVSNVGGSATSGTTTITDTLPAGLTPTAASGTGWSCGIAAQTVTCTSTDVVGSNGSFPAISITVNVGQAAAASLTNTATVSGGGELNTANEIGRAHV